MAKVEFTHGRLRFDELTAGEYFIYNDRLYIKTDITEVTDNVFDFQNGYFDTFGGNERVTIVNPGAITITVN